MLHIRKATHDDSTKVINHYITVINQIKNYEYNPGWQFGTHPTKEKLKNSINEGQLYIGIIQSQIVSSIIIDHNSLEAKKIKWQKNLKDNEIYYIHLVAVNQKYKKRGIAQQMLNYAFQKAKQNSIKSIRLSLNKNNLAIENLYLKTGFKYMGTEEVFIKQRGNITFNLYEKLL